MFSNFIPPWTLFSPTLDKIITPIDLLSAHCLHILSAAVSVFALSRRSISDPLARDQVQTSERSQTAISVALGNVPQTLSPPPSPLDLSSWSPWHVPPLSSSVHRCAPLAPRTLARDSSCAVQFELTLSNTSCTLCRRTCEGLQKPMGWASFFFHYQIRDPN